MTTGNLLNDRELLTLIKQGDRDAYGELYTRYQPPIYRFLRKYLHSDELAEDVAQNVFLKFWERREDPVIINEISAWLFTMAKRQALDFLRRAATEEAALGVILDSYVPQTELEQEMITKDYLAFIDRVLDTLPDITRQVFELCRKQHKTYDEAAQLQGSL